MDRKHTIFFVRAKYILESISTFSEKLILTIGTFPQFQNVHRLMEACDEENINYIACFMISTVLLCFEGSDE